MVLLCGGCAGGGWFSGAYLPQKNFLGIKNLFDFNFLTNKAILELKSQKWTKKSTFFAKVHTCVFTILRSKKSFLGQSCFGVV